MNRNNNRTMSLSIMMIIGMFLALVPHNATLAQEPYEPVYDSRAAMAISSISQSDEQVYLLQDGRLSRLNVSTGESQPVVELAPLVSIETTQPDRLDRRLWAADIDPMGRYLYQIEVWGRSTNRRFLNGPTQCYLVQILAVS